MASEIPLPPFSPSASPSVEAPDTMIRTRQRPVALTPAPTPASGLDRCKGEWPVQNPRKRDCWDPLFRLGLWILHILVEVFVFIMQTFYWAREILTETSSKLEKIPKSIGFAFDSSLVLTCEVARLLESCASHGIQEIFLFDMEGVLINNASHIADSAKRLHKGRVTFMLPGYSQSREMLSDKKLKDSCLGKDTTIIIFSAKSAKCYFESSVREYCSKQWPHEHQRNFNVEGEQLLGSNTPPQLVIAVGPNFSINGFPSWLVGSAELGHIKNMRDIRGKIRRILRVYDKSVQRCGA
mmetsp:Transcript_29604/g.72141  ORF Transcript_29604/g.72141 Transcript_29604/m.72141 type:complete len:296 (-) Transcript_29604:307-1194(-)